MTAAPVAPPLPTTGLPPAAGAAIPLSVRLGWATGSLGTVTVLTTTSMIFLFYMTTVLGMAAALAGALLFAAKAFDAAIAPAMGRWSDRAATRWGRRRPFLLAGALVSGLAFLLLFTPPVLSGPALVAWMLAGLMLLALGYTLFNVPYLAMPAEMTESPQERTALLSFRVAFVAVGGAVVGFAPRIAAGLGGDRAAWAATGALLGAFAAVAMGVAFLATAGARATAGPPTRSAERLSAVLANRPFLRLLLAKILQLVGLASLQASVLFLVVQVLGLSEGVVGVYVALSTVAMLASMPLWVALGRRLPKARLLVLACLGYAAVKLSFLLAGPGEPEGLVLVRGALGGLFSGGVLLMGQSLLPDAIDWDCRRTGIRREGLYAGAYSLVEKASMALGPLVVGSLLQASGFDPAAARAGEVPAGTMGVYLGAAVLPALLYGLSALPLLRFRLDEPATPARGG
ncbi:MAG: MFS transporter [Sphingomonadaceae bacterium]|uniref:MFS transporter n=1 Tax=Thermaurantiacus sp. TaxID=2820283 RepID=UPI00298F1C98|nr:MFS transporter [Thermaurantiacus sp.]MCS6987561.1 MFS transporter [Sphingomonadaceae bacterium]MDW8415162.1 MFS transporter [Thermaurantiacus sp.]